MIEKNSFKVNTYVSKVIHPSIMNDSTNEIDNDEEIFGMHFADKPAKNQRIAVRYVRTDITAFLTSFNLFNRPQKMRIKLLDISSKGAAISCKIKLSPKAKIILELLFEENQIFIIPAMIVQQINHNKYGLKFDKFNNELGDYLLSSQNDLSFK